jgi:hypothetical protein
MQNEKGVLLPDFQMSVIRGLLEKSKERRISTKGGRFQMAKFHNG